MPTDTRNDSRNPFGAPGDVPKGANAGMQLWIAVGVLAMLVIGYFAWVTFHQQALSLEHVRHELDHVRALATRSQAEAAELKDKLAGSQSRISDLETQKEAADQSHKGLEEEMRAELESKDVTISQLQGKLTVNILDRILFDSGEAVLKAPGQAVLQKIADILVQHPTLKIHVIGHTDDVPIRGNARRRFATNWELSSARALSAVRFLTETAGVDPRRVGAVAYGEFRPVAENTTPDGRARNRRIAITILPDELAGIDTVPAASTNSPSASPAAVPVPDKPTTPQ